MIPPAAAAPLPTWPNNAAGAKDGWSRLAKNLKAEIDQKKIEACKGTVSLPFEKGENSKIAVKIIDDRGIESLRVVSL